MPGSLAASDSAQPTAPSDAAPPELVSPRRRRSKKKTVLVSLLVLLLVIGAGAAGLALYARSVNSGIARVDAFNDVPETSRPTTVAAGALNMLILGSDSRDPDNFTGSRSDTIILAHLPKDRASAQLVSIPRDTWLHVPASKNGQYGNRDAKINAAYAWGGIPLTVQTVESYTGVRIDHVVLVDFAGFQKIVDALGGIDIAVERNFTSIHPPYRAFTAGRQHMDGATALDYSRQRKQFPDGDFARIRHQQQVIKAILDKAASGGLLTDPGRLNAFLRAVGSAVSVDKTLSLVDMAVDLRHLRSGNLTFITNPSSGTGMVGAESVVFADKAKDKALYAAVRRDAVSDILNAAH